MMIYFSPGSCINHGRKIMGLSCNIRIFGRWFVSGCDATILVVILMHDRLCYDYLWYTVCDCWEMTLRDVSFSSSTWWDVHYTGRCLMHAVEQGNGDDEHVIHHRSYTLISYKMYLVDKSIFVDKSVTYVDVVYLRDFADLERIHKYN